MKTIIAAIVVFTSLNFVVAHAEDINGEFGWTTDSRLTENYLDKDEINAWLEENGYWGTEAHSAEGYTGQDAHWG
ncbi:MAG: hypothetical protein HN842_09650 [Gammaproteobacteria bacterium]|jgi:hypothetical protein|nr:hypothetical protein [Gammaproteobacteria bacterium]